jgi:hypothetical protein
LLKLHERGLWLTAFLWAPEAYLQARFRAFILVERVHAQYYPLQHQSFRHSHAIHGSMQADDACDRAMMISPPTILKPGVSNLVLNKIHHHVAQQ